MYQFHLRWDPGFEVQSFLEIEFFELIRWFEV